MYNFFKKTKFAVIALVIALFSAVGLARADETPVPPGGVPIESSLAVANATVGGAYHDSVSAKVNDVINIQVWYHNPQPVNSNQIAKNVNVKINLPGDKSTKHTITSRVGGSNTNITTDIANITSSIASTLEYIPGTAVRRYNSGTNEKPNWVNQKLPDSILTTGYTVSQLKPCWNFAETITIQARVNAPVLSITKQVKIEGTSEWRTNIEARPGDTLAYLITIKNEGNVTLHNLTVRDSLPPKLVYLPGSARLINGNHPNGIVASDNLVNGGTIIGNYAPGTVAYVRFNARVPQTMDRNTCYNFNNVGVAKADEVGEYYNTANTRVCYAAPNDGIELSVIKFNDRNANRTQDYGEEFLGGWTFEVSGNNYRQRIVTDSTGRAFIRGLIPGTYTVTEVNQNGWENTTGLSITRNVTTDPQTQTFIFGNRRITPLTPPTTPPSGGDVKLPVSGPAETAASILGVMFTSGGILNYIRSRKLLTKAKYRN